MSDVAPIDYGERRWLLQQQFENPETGESLPESDRDWWRRLADMLPDDMAFDWVGTNHYELNAAGDEGFNYLTFPPEMFRSSDPSGTRWGQRVGIVMEAACSFKAAEARLTELEAALKEAGEAFDRLAQIAAQNGYDEDSRRARSVLQKIKAAGV